MTTETKESMLMRNTGSLRGMRVIFFCRYFKSSESISNAVATQLALSILGKLWLYGFFTKSYAAALKRIFHLYVLALCSLYIHNYKQQPQ